MIVTDAFRKELEYPELYKEDNWSKIEETKTPINLKDTKPESFLIDETLNNDWEMFCWDVYFNFLPFKKEEFSKVTYQVFNFVTDQPPSTDMNNYKGELPSENFNFKNEFERVKITSFLPKGDSIEEVDYDLENTSGLELPHVGFVYYFNPKPICGGTLEIRNRGGDIERIKSNPDRLILFDPKIRHSMTNTALATEGKSQKLRVLYSYLYAK